MKKYILKSICGMTFLSVMAGVLPTQINGDTINTEYRNVVEGIEYFQKQMFIGSSSKFRVNQLRVDMKNPDTGIIFAKEKKYSLGKGELSKHIQSSIENGNRVIGGINGDFFNVKAGVSVGPHVEDGKIITTYTGRSDRRKYPLIIQRKDGSVDIDKLDFNGTISVIKESVTPGMGDNNLEKVAFDSVNRYEEFIANRYKVTNYTTVATPNYSEDRRLKKSGYAPNEILVVLRKVVDEAGNPIVDGIAPDTEYTGEVVSIGGNEDGYIPVDGIIIAATGTDAQWYRDNVAIGDKIKVNASFGDSDIERMMASYSYLVEDGVAYSEAKLKEAGYSGGLLTAKRSRSAFGIDREGKLMIVTIDGGYRTREYSDGVSLPDFAKLLQEMGMVTGVNLDGGGSTEIMVKEFAGEDFDILNSPEDGRERKISNSILFTTKNDVDSKKVESIDLGELFVILKNSKHELSIDAENKYGYKIPVDYSKVKWSVSDKSSSVDGRVFNSGEEDGLVMIEASYEGKKSINYAIVIEDIDNIKLNVGEEIYLNPGDTVELSAKGISNQFGEVSLQKGDVQWRTSGKYGEIDSDGRFTANKKGINIVTCQVGEREVSLIVRIGEEKKLIDDFEDFRYDYTIDGYMGGIGAISQGQAYNGNSSFGIIYDYNTWNSDYNGTVNMNFGGLHDSKVSYAKPKYLTATVYGDGKAPWMRAELEDATGKLFTIDLAKDIDWNGWKQVYGEIPEDVVTPINLNRIYLVETHKDVEKINGAVYVDDLMYLYDDKIVNEQRVNTTTIEPIYPLNNATVSNGKFVIRAKVQDSVTDVDRYSIEVKIDRVKCQVIYDREKKELMAIPSEVLKKGKHEIIINAKNIYGESARREVITITVE